jgi:ribosomal protein S9
MNQLIVTPMTLSGAASGDMPNKSQPAVVAVIGGGVSGAATAFHLANAAATAAPRSLRPKLSSLNRVKTSARGSPMTRPNPPTASTFPLRA